MKEAKCPYCNGTDLMRYWFKDVNGKKIIQWRCEPCHKFFIKGVTLKKRGRPSKLKINPKFPMMEPSEGVAERPQHCNFSVQRSVAPDKSGFVCAFTPAVSCGGSCESRKNCPIWSSGKVF